MTKPLRDASAMLDPVDGGLLVRVNCYICGGGVAPETGSNGREQLGRCAAVRYLVYCAKCRLQQIVDVKLTVITERGG